MSEVRNDLRRYFESGFSRGAPDASPINVERARENIARLARETEFFRSTASEDGYTPDAVEKAVASFRAEPYLKDGLFIGTQKAYDDLSWRTLASLKTIRIIK